MREWREIDVEKYGELVYRFEKWHIMADNRDYTYINIYIASKTTGEYYYTGYLPDMDEGAAHKRVLEIVHEYMNEN